jgi:NADH-quinone oxidoreductase subunit N
MNFDLLIPSQLLAALTPDIVLMVGAMGLMLLAAWGPESDDRQALTGYGAMVVIVAALGAVIWASTNSWTSGPGVIAVDRFRWASDIIFLVAALGTVALTMEYNKREGILSGETHVLVLFAVAGMMILAAARDLMIVFLGIELMSIPVYVLAGLNRRSLRAAEGSLKYFLLGAFASGFLLYGIALIYGATGSTNLTEIGQRIDQYRLFHHSMLMIGVGLLTIGLGFKVAVVPFHMWAPDVYEGAPIPTTGFMAAAVKAAAFAAFLRIWREALADVDFAWFAPIWMLAAVTMVFGNVVALAQRNIKRLFAYSSIVHSGYLLLAVLAGSRTGASAFLFYLFAYTLAALGTFAVVSAVSEPGERRLELSDYDGLWTIRPGLAVAMSVFMLSLLGFPIFGGIGFFAKWYLLQAALSAQTSLTPLVVLLVLTSVVSAGYYLNIVRVMFMKPRGADAADPKPIGALTRAVIVATAVAIVVLGIFPSQLAVWSKESVMTPPVTSAQTPVTTASK